MVTQHKPAHEPIAYRFLQLPQSLKVFLRCDARQTEYCAKA
jgi:hypothetical protein